MLGDATPASSSPKMASASLSYHCRLEGVVAICGPASAGRQSVPLILGSERITRRTWACGSRSCRKALLLRLSLRCYRRACSNRGHWIPSRRWVGVVVLLQEFAGRVVVGLLLDIFHTFATFFDEPLHNYFYWMLMASSQKKNGILTFLVSLFVIPNLNNSADEQNSDKVGSGKEVEQYRLHYGSNNDGYSIDRACH